MLWLFEHCHLQPRHTSPETDNQLTFRHQIPDYCDFLLRLLFPVRYLIPQLQILRRQVRDTQQDVCGKSIGPNLEVRRRGKRRGVTNGRAHKAEDARFLLEVCRCSIFSSMTDNNARTAVALRCRNRLADAERLREYFDTEN